MSKSQIHTHRAIEGLSASSPMVLPFALTSVVRAFLLEREPGNLLVYSTGRLEDDAERLIGRGGASRQYLSHWHEAVFGLPSATFVGRTLLHQADAPSLAELAPRIETFSGRHLVDDDFEVIPIPGHTPGSTAYLWTRNGQRLLFTSDTVYLHAGEWRVAVLPDSDRVRYVESLELLREIEFDVLVPWVVGADDPYFVPVDPRERRQRIDELIARVLRL